MRYRITAASALVAAAALVLAGCAGTSATATSDTSSAETVEVGAVLQARGDVDPWSSTWAASLGAVAAEDPTVKITTSYEAADPTAAEPVIRQLLDAGSQVVLMPTFILGDVAATIAAEYPDVPMLVTGVAAPQAPNLWAAAPSFLEMGYATCWALTSLSDDGRIGVVKAVDDPVQSEIQVGCDLGAKAANPDASITTVNSNSYTDQQANREQTQRLLDDGIDEIYFISGSEDSLGGFAVCAQEDARCASYGDTQQWLPTGGVEVITMDWSGIITTLIEQAEAGAPAADFFNATLENGGLVASLSGNGVTDELVAEFDAMIAQLADGTIELPDSVAHPGYR
ncbi:MAG TPA: hypothetical protein DHW40_11660 [Microbacterium sp.]|nr:hypothetical protein [Microbacterium sp.]